VTPAVGNGIVRDGLQGGSRFVHDFVGSDPRLAFGGVSDPGCGRGPGTLMPLEVAHAETDHVV